METSVCALPATSWGAGGCEACRGPFPAPRREKGALHRRLPRARLRARALELARLLKRMPRVQAAEAEAFSNSELGRLLKQRTETNKAKNEASIREKYCVRECKFTLRSSREPRTSKEFLCEECRQEFGVILGECIRIFSGQRGRCAFSVKFVCRVPGGRCDDASRVDCCDRLRKIFEEAVYRSRPKSVEPGERTRREQVCAKQVVGQVESNRSLIGRISGLPGALAPQSIVGQVPPVVLIFIWAPFDTTVSLCYFTHSEWLLQGRTACKRPLCACEVFHQQIIGTIELRSRCTFAATRAM
jgi:hypothetical protein